MKLTQKRGNTTKGIILWFVCLLMLLIPADTVFANNRKTDVNFTVEEIQNAGIEDRHFAEAIYESVLNQPDKFVNGNTLTDNPFTSMEELLNNFNGDINASNKGITNIVGFPIIRSANKIDISNNKINDIRPISIAREGVEWGDLENSEKKHYGEYGRETVMNIVGNPIMMYPQMIGGRVNLKPAITANHVYLYDKTYIFIKADSADATSTFSVPLNLWVDSKRPLFSTTTTKIKNMGDVDTGATILSDLSQRLEHMDIGNINKTGSFDIIMAAHTHNRITMGRVNSPDDDFILDDTQNISWSIPVKTLIYTRIESKSISLVGSVSLLKLGSDDNKTKSGAEYSLYKKVNDELIAEKLVTDKDGLLKVDSLEPADYYFVETKAPQGYELDPTPIEFTIENGSIDILGGSGNKLTPTDGEELTIDGTFVLSGSDEAPASVVINEPTDGAFDTLTLEWTEGNQVGTAGKIVYQLGTGTSTEEIVYVANKEEAEQKVAVKLKECRDLYQNVKVSATFKQELKLNQRDEPISKIEKAVKKVWDDNNNQDGIRPLEINVQLYADGKAVGESVVLNNKNSWSVTWSELAKYKDGKEITYSVKEVTIPDEYIAKVENDKDGNFTLINTYVPSPGKPTNPDKPLNPEQPVKPNADAPPTGDTTNLGVLIVALLGSAGLLEFGLLKRRRKGDKV